MLDPRHGLAAESCLFSEKLRLWLSSKKRARAQKYQARSISCFVCSKKDFEMKSVQLLVAAIDFVFVVAVVILL